MLRNHPYRAPPQPLQVGDRVDFVGLTWEEWIILPVDVRNPMDGCGNGALFREHSGKVVSISRFGDEAPAFEVRFPHCTQWQFFHAHELKKIETA